MPRAQTGEMKGVEFAESLDRCLLLCARQRRSIDPSDIRREDTNQGGRGLPFTRLNLPILVRQPC